MDNKIGKEFLRRIPAEVFEGIQARIIAAEVDENDQTVEVIEKVTGLALKNELISTVARPESEDFFKKDLKELGLKDEQYYVRKKIINAIDEYVNNTK